MLEDQEKVQNIILFVLEMKILIKNITKKLIAMSRLDFYSSMISYLKVEIFHVGTIFKDCLGRFPLAR